MVDAEMESPIPTARSSEEEHSTSSVDLKKKRKLQYELGILDMPSTKHRITVGANILEEPSIRETHNDLEPCLEESENDNSFIGAYDNSMASDVKVLDEYSITLTSNHGQSSTSLNNYSNEVIKRYFYSLKSRGIKKMRDATTADLEETLQYDPGYKVAEEIYPVFGLDHAILELESEDNAETESMILYTNDVAPHSFMCSSGCWNLGQGMTNGKAWGNPMHDYLYIYIMMFHWVQRSLPLIKNLSSIFLHSCYSRNIPGCEIQVPLDN